MKKSRFRKRERCPKKDRPLFRKLFIVFLILFSYFFSYGLPLIYSYNILRGELVTKTFTWASRGVGFLGFLAFSFVLGLAFLVRVGVILARKRGSIARVVFFGGLLLLFLLLGVYFINKVLEFSSLVETGAIQVLEGLRLFFKGFRAILVVTMIGQGLSMICKIVAIKLDPRWVKEIDWI